MHHHTLITQQHTSDSVTRPPYLACDLRAGVSDLDVQINIPLQVFLRRSGHQLRIVNLRPCLDVPKNLKIYKILYHIKSCGTCMEH